MPGPEQRTMRNRRPRRRMQTVGRAPVTETDEMQELEAARERNDLDAIDLREMSAAELAQAACEGELDTRTDDCKDDLVYQILQRQTERAAHAYPTGTLDVVEEGNS